MKFLKFSGNHGQFFELGFDEVELASKIELDAKNESSEAHVQLKIKSGSLESSFIQHVVEFSQLISFLKQLKIVISTLTFYQSGSASAAQAQVQSQSQVASPQSASQLLASSLQNEDDMVWIRLAVRDDQKEFWIYGHVLELNHKNKISFSFEGIPSDLLSLRIVLDSIEV